VGQHLDGAAATGDRRIEVLDDVEPEAPRALTHRRDRFGAQARGLRVGVLHAPIRQLELRLHHHDALGRPAAA
jgi:hypothetical protein